MAETTFLDLPSEIQQLIVSCVAKISFQDLYRLRSTCLRDMLLRRCYDVGNPSTLYIKGVEYFYALQCHEEGLALMKRAADAGYERALYTYAMTRKLYWDDEQVHDHVNRSTLVL
ncbi:hypothetical protein Bca52824_073160 [Brassica carinata]|uniref:At2g35280-like TPR domain-containing protein n=1 Tax=Brassica carinata TaxID=52824 RepID=A0A8X7Q9C2_BRACI|nr:hypothetical protein Bca52824_073160 [Brassica carinata]